MGGPLRTLSHIPFFEALARSDETSEEWREVSAGLLTLRLFDAWMLEGATVVAADSWSLASVREAIEGIRARYSIRSLLSSVVEAMVAARTPSLNAAAPRLVAYGRALQLDSRWMLAADVFRTVLAHAHPSDEPDTVIAANMQLGRSLRIEADWHGALEAYRTAGEVAESSGDLMNMLRSRIGEANVARDRGNLPQAGAMLDETIEALKAAGLKELHALALHDRATVAHRRGDFALAVKLAYASLQGAKDPHARDRVLADLAASLYELGVRSAARDAHLILAGTAQEQYTRWRATINLLEIASIDRSEPVFEQYRRELADASLPASLSAEYHLYVGRGYRMFGRMTEARSEITKAMSIAEAHQLNQLLIEAELSLKELEGHGRTGMRHAEQEPPEEIAAVTSAIEEMRRLVTAR
jgi:tetratricopeptide (TPR) repeat protein